MPSPKPYMTYFPFQKLKSLYLLHKKSSINQPLLKYSNCNKREYQTDA